MKILITGGAGFIGSSVIRLLLNNGGYSVFNVDKLTYAGNFFPWDDFKSHPNYHFYKLDICDQAQLTSVFEHCKPNVVLHLAAESHVDRSIRDPHAFIETNISGTFSLLEVSRRYYELLNTREKRRFRFHHVSTDEVFGDCNDFSGPAKESHRYAPSSPYAASKASADHLVRAWGRTFGLPVLVSLCSNNYGPRQFPEKLIPRTIINAIGGRHIPVYGDGLQTRDWLFVDDHAIALEKIFTKGMVGHTYNICGRNQRRNIDVIFQICSFLEELVPTKPDGITNWTDLITYVKDRPGHDISYSIDDEKIEKELGWRPTYDFVRGLRNTVEWYLDHQLWWKELLC